MQMGVEFSPSQRQIVSFNEPNFWLLELKSHIQMQNGGTKISYTGKQLNFGAKEWQSVVNSNGKFDALGYIMVTNQPVIHEQLKR